MSSFLCFHIIPLLILVTLPRAMSYGTSLVSCEDDARCAPHEFCYVSGLCVPCENCATYHRHTPDFIDCVKEAKQCGACFEGWKDDIFTTGDRRDHCISTRVFFKQVPPEQYIADPVIRFAQLGEFILIAVTASVFIIGGFLWCRTNWTKPSRVLPTHTVYPSRCQTTLISREQANPSRIIPSANHPEQTRQHATTTTHFWDLPEGLSDQLVENVETPSTSRSSTMGAGIRVAHTTLGCAPSEVVHTTIFTAEGFKEAAQEAVPFRRPCYEMSDGSEVEELEDEIQEHHSAPQSPDLSFLHDQDTMPSAWTPANQSTSSNDSAHWTTANQNTSSNDSAHSTAPGAGPSNETSNDSDAPQPKRLRVSNSESDSGIDVFHPVSGDPGSAEEMGINLYITNNVVIRKA